MSAITPKDEEENRIKYHTLFCQELRLVKSMEVDYQRLAEIKKNIQTQEKFASSTEQSAENCAKTIADLQKTYETLRLKAQQVRSEVSQQSKCSNDLREEIKKKQSEKDEIERLKAEIQKEHLGSCDTDCMRTSHIFCIFRANDGEIRQLSGVSLIANDWQIVEENDQQNKDNTRPAEKEGNVESTRNGVTPQAKANVDEQQNKENVERNNENARNTNTLQSGGNNTQEKNLDTVPQHQKEQGDDNPAPQEGDEDVGDSEETVSTTQKRKRDETDKNSSKPKKTKPMPQSAAEKPLPFANMTAKERYAQREKARADFFTWVKTFRTKNIKTPGDTQSVGPALKSDYKAYKSVSDTNANVKSQPHLWFVDYFWALSLDGCGISERDVRNLYSMLNSGDAEKANDLEDAVAQHPPEVVDAIMGYKIAKGDGANALQRCRQFEQFYNANREKLDHLRDIAERAHDERIRTAAKEAAKQGFRAVDAGDEEKEEGEIEESEEDTREM